jgi:hypothetical protein
MREDYTLNMKGKDTHWIFFFFRVKSFSFFLVSSMIICMPMTIYSVYSHLFLLIIVLKGNR